MYIPTYDDLARRKQQGAGLYLESSRGFIDVSLLGETAVFTLYEHGYQSHWKTDDLVNDEWRPAVITFAGVVCVYA